MTLRKDDISLLNRFSAQQEELQNPSTDDVLLYKSILEHSASWSVDYGKTNNDFFEAIINKIDVEKIDTRKPRGFAFLKIAASIVLIAISSLLTYDFIDTKSIDAEMAEIKTVYLPDSSKVILNAVSNISYSTSDWNNGHRILELDGQAYFEVKKGSHFQVKSDHGIVSVLGTSFNIYDREGDYNVECFTGKVSVETAISDTKVYLTKGLKTRLQTLNTKALQEPEVFNEAKSIEWTNGIFNFYNTPLDKVFKEIERQFDIEIKYSSTSTKYYTGTFNKNDLKKSLINICKPMGYEYELKENIFLIIDN